LDESSQTYDAAEVRSHSDGKEWNLLDGEGVVVGADSVAKVSRLPWTSYLLILLVGVTATAWLVHRLDHRFLWQDEAMTAVLGERLMKFGRPMGYDGKNLITMDIMGEHEEQAFP
jgi:hypothetical protein